MISAKSSSTKPPCHTQRRIRLSDTFEITVDGKPRSYPDMKVAAMDAAEFLKRRNPNSPVAVKDVRNGEVTLVAYKPG